MDDDPQLTIFSFFNVLNVLSGIDSAITPAAAVFNEINEKMNTESDLKAILKEKVEEVEKREKAVLEKLDICHGAKMSLEKELARVNKEIENNTEIKRHLYIAKKCAQSAYNFLNEQISQQKLSQLQGLTQPSITNIAETTTDVNLDKPSAIPTKDIQPDKSEKAASSAIKKTPLQDKIEKVWWFMENIDPNNTSNFKSALVEFLNFFASVETIPVENETLAFSFVQKIMHILPTSLPDVQQFLLRILTEIVSKSSFQNSEKLISQIVSHIRSVSGFELICRLINSINEGVSGEACVLLSTLCKINDEIRVAFGNIEMSKKNSGTIQFLIELLYRSQNEEVLEKAVIAMWTLGMNDNNKKKFGELGGIEAICSLLKYIVKVLTLEKLEEEQQAAAQENSEKNAENAEKTSNSESSSNSEKIAENPISAVLEKENQLSEEEEARLKEEFETRLSILENVIICLGYLTRYDQNKIIIRNCEGIEILFDAMKCMIINTSSSNEKSRRNISLAFRESIISKAAGSIWNIASNKENKAILREMGMIKFLIDLLEIGNDEIIENVTGALWNCAVETANKTEIIENNGIEKLVDCLIIQQEIQLKMQNSENTENSDNDSSNNSEKLGVVSRNNETIVENIIGTLWNCASIKTGKDRIFSYFQKKQKQNSVVMKKISELLKKKTKKRSSTVGAEK